ncbi:hypothetical protein HELRODRAFT_158678 [Helobdella robusta]|uniref:CRC domain-containing protein n=1 Tax=Helobdella robusta TaxID=6412 RepID=T1EN42_HELRO|nr:hypothetical protein HELRODRAFT_158678 [Helobdella robusta]ESO12211.1 hypothetical protein HELRODRAFT_158678 [Helobdella robusta]
MKKELILVVGIFALVWLTPSQCSQEHVRPILMHYKCVCPAAFKCQKEFKCLRDVMECYCDQCSCFPPGTTHQGSARKNFLTTVKRQALMDSSAMQLRNYVPI